MKKLWIVPIILFSVSGLAEGHNLGQSLEQKVGNFLVDIGYSATDNIRVGDAIRFDFNLWENNGVDVADFDHVWVRITPKEEGIDFAGFLYRPEFLLTGMSYTFQKAGEYELTVRFLNRQERALAEAVFPLKVVPSKFNWHSLVSVEGIVGIIFGVLVGAGISYLLLNKKKVVL